MLQERCIAVLQRRRNRVVATILAGMVSAQSRSSGTNGSHPMLKLVCSLPEAPEGAMAVQR